MSMNTFPRLTNTCAQLLRTFQTSIVPSLQPAERINVDVLTDGKEAAIII